MACLPLFLFRQYQSHLVRSWHGVAHLGVDPGKVDAALGYYADFRDEIDAWIERVDAEAERVRQAWKRRRNVLA